MKKIKELLKKVKTKFSVISTTIVGTLILAESRVLADSNTQSIDSFINFACDWLTKIGGVIALVGRCNVRAGMAKRRCRGKIKRTYDSYGRFYACSNCTI